MKKVSQIWFNIQGFLFPFIEKEIEEPLTEKLKQMVATLKTRGHYVATLVMLQVLDILPFKYQKYIFFAYNSSSYYIL